MRQSIEVSPDLVPPSCGRACQDESGAWSVQATPIIVLTGHETKPSRGIVKNAAFVLNGAINGKPTLLAKITPVQDALTTHQGKVGFDRRRSLHGIV
jgi:hypothetical protein